MKKIFIIAIFIVCCPITVFAHDKPLDEYGGHYQNHLLFRSTYYHYHHGFAAHQHIGGLCPYEQGWLNPYEDLITGEDYQEQKEEYETWSYYKAVWDSTAATGPYEEPVKHTELEIGNSSTEDTSANFGLDDFRISLAEGGNPLFIAGLLFFTIPIMAVIKYDDRLLSKKQLLKITFVGILFANVVSIIIFKSIYAVTPNFIWGYLIYFFMKKKNKSDYEWKINNEKTNLESVIKDKKVKVIPIKKQK